tara:strand:- start:263 stop:664 length:402 start_codon:yes stop_codon:yes gene_type:complete
MDEDYRNRLHDYIDRTEQATFERHLRELKKDPRKFSRTTIFSESVNQNETWFTAGEDKEGNETSFGYTIGRNVAGFFLTFKVVTSDGVCNYSDFQPHKKRKNAKRLSAARADEEREKQGREKIFEHHYERGDQ